MKCYSSGLGPEVRAGFLQATEEHLSESFSLFDLDEMHCQIVKGHQIMLKISRREDVKSIVPLAGEIGSWGLRTSNEGISEFIGSLLIRFGRRLLNHSEVDKALACFEEQYGAFQAMVSTLTVHSLIKNHLHARYLIEQQRQHFHDLLDLFEKVAELNPIYSTFRESRINIITSYDGVVSPIYRGLGDYNALKEWRAEVKALHKGYNITATFREMLQDPFFSNFFGKASQFLTSATSTWNILDFLMQYLKQWGSYLLSPFRTTNKPPEPKQDEDAVFEALFNSHSILDQYSVAVGRYWDLIQRAEIDEAESHLRAFYLSLESMAPTFSTRAASILIGRDLGDLDIISKHLASLTDAELLGDWTMEKYKASKRAQKPSSPLQFRSHPHFCIALNLCALGRQWERGYKLLQIIDTTDPDFFDLEGWRDTDMWDHLTSAGLIAGHNGELERGFKYLMQALELVEAFRSNISEQEARRSMISTTSINNITVGLILLHLTCRDQAMPVDKKELNELEEELGSDDGGIDFEQPMLPVNLDIDPSDLYSAIDEDALVVESLYSQEAVCQFAISRQGVLLAEKMNLIPTQFRRSMLKIIKALREAKGMTLSARKEDVRRINDLLQAASSSTVASESLQPPTRFNTTLNSNTFFQLQI
jgi:hypothetical protein